MAQAFVCEDHGEEGVMYLSTLQGEIRTMTLCPSCLPEFIMGWAQSLGLIDQLLEQAHTAQARGDEDTSEFMFTGTREQWDRWVAALYNKWARKIESVSLEDWKKAVALRVIAPDQVSDGVPVTDEQLADAVAWVDEREAASQGEDEG